MRTLHSSPEENITTEISSFVQLSAPEEQLERQHYLAFMPGAELMSLETLHIKGREGKGREGKGREGKGREGKGREGKGRG